MEIEKSTEKQDRYTTLKVKLKKAVTLGFWLEACMIEYAMIEDRTSSILYYAGISSREKAYEKQLQNKLKSIEYQIGKKHPIISKKVNSETIRQLLIWKDSRNELVHKACRVYDEEAAKTIAEEGRILLERINSDSRKVKKAVIKQGAK